MSSSRRSVAQRVIIWLVSLYPDEVRVPHGDELLEHTVSRWSEARVRGLRAAVVWWVTEGSALAWGALAERLERWFGRQGARSINPTREGVVVLCETEGRRIFRAVTRNARTSVALLAVLTVALGVTAGVFAFVDGILLKPLRYAGSDRLVAIWAAQPADNLERVPLTQWDIQQLIARKDVFESVGGFTQQRSALQLPDRVVEIGQGWLTSELHHVLRVQPVLGRTFTVEDRGELVLLLDYDFWQQQFAGDPDILGKSVRIAQQSWTIVGVLPAETPFELPSRGRVPLETDVWSIMWVDGPDPNATAAWIRTVARLAPDVSLQRAREVASQIARDARTLYEDREAAQFDLVVHDLRDDFTAGISQQLKLLLAGTLILLVAAGANAGNLIVLQLQRRRYRTAIQVALGASRRRLVLQGLGEAILLTSIAGLLAIPVAQGVLNGLLASTPSSVPRLDMVELDERSLGFLAAAVLLSAFLIGGLSALWTSKVPSVAAVRSTRLSRTAWSGVRLVTAEIAISVPLLVLAALLGRSAERLSAVDSGFDPGGAVAIRLALPNHELNREQVGQLLATFNESLSGLPGVESVGSANLLPLGGGAFTGSIARHVGELDERTAVDGDYRYVTPGYLESVGLRLVDGEWPRKGGGTNVVAVDESLARKLWPNAQPLGQRLAASPLGDSREDFTVAAVVSTARHESLREAGRPTVYFLSPEYTLPYMTTVVRGDLDVGSLVRPATEIGRSVHRDLLVAEVRSLDELIESATSWSTWLVLLVVALALGATLITMLGLYAVVGQFVATCRPALGVRRALGARGSHLTSLLARQLVIMMVSGLLVGAVMALWASSWLRSELFGVQPSDPITWLTVIAALCVFSGLAVAVPVRRALAVSPLVALGHES